MESYRQFDLGQLLSIETEEKFGYKIKELSSGSSRMIIHTCVVCGLPKETPYRLFLQGRGVVHFGCKTIRTQQTNLRKYGVDSVWHVPQIQEKAKQTNLSRFGVENPSGLPKVQEKRRQTNLKRYGVEHFSQSPKVRNKVKQTNLKRYGVEYISQSSEVQDKVKQTNLEKYGVEHFLQSVEVRERIKQTNIKKYGADNPRKSSKIKEKIKRTTLEKYGVISVAQLPENRNKLKEWCIDNPEKCFSPRSEIEILEWVRQYYPSAQKHKDGTYEIDVFIPDIDLGIEHNGLFYHQEDKIGSKYHLNKTKYFQGKNIRIIHIFEHEWKFRQEQVKSFLLSVFGKNQYKIGARKCEVVWSSFPEDIQEIHRFLEDYHIQGQPVNTKYVIKVLHNNDLLAVATFGKHHRSNKNWVLTRFCTKTNYTIQGVLSKISKLASQQLKEDIISWADFRLSNGNGYEKAGWVFEELLPPDYFYHAGGCRVISKQSRQKRIVKTPKGMTESEHATQDGLHKVYDCGKKRYIFIHDNIV